jgi:hypothetical protein
VVLEDLRETLRSPKCGKSSWHSSRAQSKPLCPLWVNERSRQWWIVHGKQYNDTACPYSKEDWTIELITPASNEMPVQEHGIIHVPPPEDASTEAKTPDPRQDMVSRGVWKKSKKPDLATALAQSLKDSMQTVLGSDLFTAKPSHAATSPLSAVVAYFFICERQRSAMGHYSGSERRYSTCWNYLIVIWRPQKRIYTK